MRILLAASLTGAALLAAGSVLANTPENTPVKAPVAEASPAPAPTPPADNAAATPASGATETVEAPSAAPTKPKPMGPIVVANVNLTTQKMTVSVNGTITHTWAVSSGLPGFPTPRGSFTATWMSKMHYSKQYDDAPMPHSVFFKDGAAIHGTYATRALGRPASHGCVRLAPGNAATFYNLVSRYGITRTRVVVHGNLPPVRVASRRTSNNSVASRSRDNDDYSYRDRDRRRDERRSSRRDRDRRWPGDSYAWSGSNRGPSYSRY